MDEQNDITQLLIEWKNGDKNALDDLMPLVYDELRRIARGHLNRESNTRTNFFTSKTSHNANIFIA